MGYGIPAQKAGMVRELGPGGYSISLMKAATPLPWDPCGPKA